MSLNADAGREAKIANDALDEYRQWVDGMLPVMQTASKLLYNHGHCTSTELETSDRIDKLLERAARLE